MTKNGAREELTMIERNTAYGVTVGPNADEEGTFKVTTWPPVCVWVPPPRLAHSGLYRLPSSLLRVPSLD
jgi:hypothetical protein